MKKLLHEYCMRYADYSHSHCYDNQNGHAKHLVCCLCRKSNPVTDARRSKDIALAQDIQYLIQKAREEAAKKSREKTIEEIWDYVQCKLQDVTRIDRKTGEDVAKEASNDTIRELLRDLTHLNSLK